MKTDLLYKHYRVEVLDGNIDVTDLRTGDKSTITTDIDIDDVKQVAVYRNKILMVTDTMIFTIDRERNTVDHTMRIDSHLARKKILPVDSDRGEAGMYVNTDCCTVLYITPSLDRTMLVIDYKVLWAGDHNLLIMRDDKVIDRATDVVHYARAYDEQIISADPHYIVVSAGAHDNAKNMLVYGKERKIVIGSSEVAVVADVNFVYIAYLDVKGEPKFITYNYDTDTDETLVVSKTTDGDLDYYTAGGINFVKHRETGSITGFLSDK